MKNNKKLNENVTVNLLGLTKRYPVLSNRLDTIAESLHNLPNVTVQLKDVLMVVEGMNRGNIANFIIDELKNAKVSDVKKSDILPYMKAKLNRVNEDYDWDKWDDVEDDEYLYEPEFDDDDTFADDLFDSIEDDDKFDDDDSLNDEASFEDQVFDECDEFIEECMNECGDCDDCCDEDEEFDECLHESENKKKGCCPPVKNSVNEGFFHNIRKNLHNFKNDVKLRVNLKLLSSLYKDGYVQPYVPCIKPVKNFSDLFTVNAPRYVELLMANATKDEFIFAVTSALNAVEAAPDSPVFLVFSEINYLQNKEIYNVMMELINDRTFGDDVIPDNIIIVILCDDKDWTSGYPRFDKRVKCVINDVMESKNYSVKGRKLVNLQEGIKSIRMEDAKRTMSINENMYQNAMKKAKMSNKEIARKQSALKHIKESIGKTKYNDIIKALKEGRTTFYTKKNINGKNIQEYTSNELYKLYKEIKEQIKNIQRANKLNESIDTDKLELKKRLLAILDEELTYRLTAKKFLAEEENLDPNKETEVKEEAESTEEKTDDSNETTEEPSTEETTEDTESENKEENPEEDEEVELARIIITVANQEAADDLKSELVDAGIPEDAIEFETESEEEKSDEDDTENTESTEEGDDATAESEGEANESLHVNTFRKLLEDDESTPDTTEGDEATAEGEAESTDDTEATEEDNTPVKVILTKTDYIETLAQVLNDVYGVSQEEFEEMIGGAIVTDDSEDESEDSEENKDEEKTEDSKEEKSSNGDDAVDNMSDEDLAALFGESANK